MAQEVSEKTVKAMEPPASGNRIVYDQEVKGFGVRITKAGAKAFILNYRVGRQERRITIGSYPDWKVSAARDRAKELKKEIDKGHDPMADRHEQRTAPTVADLAQLYRETHLPRKRDSSRVNDENLLTNHVLPRLGKKRVADVRRTDVAAMHREIGKTAPIAANRTLALVSKMFAVAAAEEWRADNPCKGVERNPENRRERFLSPAEIGRLADAITASKQKVSANALRLLLLTGARRGETLAAKWSEFDLAAGVWVKPSAHTKSKKSHRVPLSAPALLLVTEMQAAAKEGCPFLFPTSTVPGKDAKGRPVWSHLTDVKRTWATVCKAAGLVVEVAKLTPAGKPVLDKKGEPVTVWQPTVRLHDLRHTYASVLASSGMSLPIIGALLGHTQAATTQRYSHLMDDPLRAATERMGSVVTGAGKIGADVVQLRKGA
jgi:integrase